MSSESNLKGSCVECDGHLEFPASLTGTSIACPHCGAETRLESHASDASNPASPEAPRPADSSSSESKPSSDTAVPGAGEPKVMDALKAGVDGFAKAASLTAKKVGMEGFAEAARQTARKAGIEARKVSAEARKHPGLGRALGQARERLAGFKGDPVKFRKRLRLAGIGAGVLFVGWLAWYQPWKSEFERYRMWADRGSAKYQMAVALMYLEGKGGVEKDTAKALEWCTKSAEQGYVDAQFNLGWWYSGGDGLGIRIDHEAAYKWLLAAAEQGDEEAQAYLGTMNYLGQGRRKDYDEALKWFRRVESHPTSQYMLGFMYLNGEGVKKDPEEAFDWWSRGADQDDPDCLLQVAYAYYQGWGVKKDYKKGMRAAERAHELGNVQATAELGHLYANTDVKPNDPDEAFRLLTQAAEAGNADGKVYLGWCYLEGIGVRKDRRKGIALVQESARLGSTHAKDWLQRNQQNQMMSILGAAFSLGFGGDGGGSSGVGGFDAGTQMYYDRQWQKYQRK